MKLLLSIAFAAVALYPADGEALDLRSEELLENGA